MPPNNRSPNSESIGRRVGRVVGKTLLYSGPIPKAQVHGDPPLAVRPTHQAKQANGSRNGGDVNSRIPGNTSSKRVSKLPMGNRPDWIM